MRPEKNVEETSRNSDKLIAAPAGPGRSGLLAKHSDGKKTWKAFGKVWGTGSCNSLFGGGLLRKRAFKGTRPKSEDALVKFD